MSKLRTKHSTLSRWRSFTFSVASDGPHFFPVMSPRSIVHPLTSWGWHRTLTTYCICAQRHFLIYSKFRFRSFHWKGCYANDEYDDVKPTWQTSYFWLDIKVMSRMTYAENVSMKPFTMFQLASGSTTPREKQAMGMRKETKEGIILTSLMSNMTVKSKCCSPNARAFTIRTFDVSALKFNSIFTLPSWKTVTGSLGISYKKQERRKQQRNNLDLQS